MLMNNRKVGLVFEGQIGCYRVAMAETVSIPPRSEMVVEGKVNDHILNGQLLFLHELSVTVQTNSLV
jgi:hypothetical protein